MQLKPHRKSKRGITMEINAKSSDRNLLLEFSGELDHHGARNSLREVEMAIDAALPKTLVLDMSGITFMDSSGIAVVLRVKKRMDETDGDVFLLNPAPQCARVFRTSGIDRFVAIKFTEEKAAR